MSRYNHDLFCVRFNQLIEEKGISQLELSKAMNLSQAVISSIKTRSGKSPSADTIFLIANYFGVSVDWLLGLSNVKTTDKATKEQIYQEGYVAGYNALKNKIQEFTKNI